MPAKIPEPDGALIAVVVDGEVAREAQLLAVAAEQARAGGVEGADRQIARRAGHEAIEALLHLAGGLVRERHGEDLVGGCAYDKYGTPLHDDTMAKAQAVDADALHKVRDDHVRMSLELQQAFGLGIGACGFCGTRKLKQRFHFRLLHLQPIGLQRQLHLGFTVQLGPFVGAEVLPQTGLRLRRVQHRLPFFQRGADGRRATGHQPLHQDH